VRAGGTLIAAAAPFFSVLFLGRALTFMTVYVWARRNPHVRLSLFGLFTFTAPYLPWVLVGFSMILNHNPTDDILGIVAGHAYYYLEDVFPRISGGSRPLRTPWLLRAAFGEVDIGRARAAPAVTVEHAPVHTPMADAAAEHVHAE
jgi:Derlin-2/3